MLIGKRKMMGGRKKLFLCETIHSEAYRLLADRMEILTSPLQMPEADALLSRTIHVGEEELDRMKHLRVIAVHGTGTDAIDLAAAAKHGVKVVYAPHLNANAVAEMNAALLLALIRKIIPAKRLMEEPSAGRSSEERSAEAQALLYGHELKGKTIGFIGFGAIGSRSSEIFHHGFGMRCIAWSRSLTAERAAAFGAEKAGSADQVFREGDVVCLSLPLTEETRNMVSEDQIRMMKKGAVLLNCSRGGLVDEEALFRALQSGHLSGAALDVMQEEFPENTHPLLSLPNVVVTPHVAMNTDEALRAVGMCCARQILDVLDGKEAEYPVKTG